MGVSQSNLSDAHYGFDLVVAVTQASVNVTLKQLLAGLPEKQVVICYVYDDDDNLIPIDYGTLLANAKGSDPFSVPDKSSPSTNPDLVNLAEANFAGAVKAAIGLPDVALSRIPAIAALGVGSDAPVKFNLLCSEFQVTGFEYGARGRATWINQTQPTGANDPWYFSADVKLNIVTVDPKSSVPKAVQQRIIDLQHSVQNAFTIQKLFLDLDTAILTSTPDISGIPEGMSVWNLIKTVFLTAYFAQLSKTGDPVLSYSFTLHDPKPATLQLGSVSRECLALLDGGTRITDPTPAQANAAALVYIGSQSRTPPITIPFAWNWVELAEVVQFSGVQAVRRDIFFKYLGELISPDLGNLCIVTNVNMSHSGEDFTVRYSHRVSDAPSRFAMVPTIGSPASDGFVDVLTASFVTDSSDDSTTATHAAGISGDYNYNLSGTVAVNGNQIRIKVRSTVYMEFKHREVVANYTDLSGKNYYDKTLTVDYVMAVSQDGTVSVSKRSSVADGSADWDFDPKGILGKLGLENDIKNGLTEVDQKLSSYLDSAFGNYANNITNTINGSKAWVFPGNDAFTFKDIGFSTGTDLIARLTYVNPD